MPRNTEIKARVSDLQALRARVASLVTGDAPQVLHQTDTFFVVAQGRLKLRQFDDGSGELIFYRREDRPGPKQSFYVRSPCHDPKTLREALGGALGIRGVVEKRREVFLLGPTRIHLDEVRGLGSFLELEVVLEEGQPHAEGERIARELLHQLGIREPSLVSGAYIDLIEKQEAHF